MRGERRFLWVPLPESFQWSREKGSGLGECAVAGLKEARERPSDARKAPGNGTDPISKRKTEGEAQQMEAEALQRDADDGARLPLSADLARPNGL